MSIGSIFDNKLTDRSEWDPKLLAVHFKELTSIALDFEIEATGFEIGEIDLLIQAADDAQDEAASDGADEIPDHEGPVVSRQGDLWILENHRVRCGDSRDPNSYVIVMAGRKAAGVFCDSPYNVKINGHASGRGKAQRREFAMASGEMSISEFTDFLTGVFKLLIAHSAPGSIHFLCIDWRHLRELLAAGAAAYSELLNLCVWAKAAAGMGALYRSRHELVFVFKNGLSKHTNNIMLGKHGRNRSNIWTYAGVKNFADKEKNLTRAHPTPKPTALVADAILDVTKPNDIVLDPFLGSGTTIIAAERTGRCGYGMEIDPRYVDVIIRRWERLTEKKARHESGRTFEEIRAERSKGHGR
jgi:DNA modification methylase